MPESQITHLIKNPWPQKWGKKTAIMGILNITPDSFSDGGLYLDPEDAVSRVSEQLDQGADIIDIGAQSTRPGANLIEPEEELNRLIPVLKTIRNLFPDILISIDTFHSKVAHKALEYGANWINDVTAGREDARILDVVCEAKCPYVLTHSRGNSKTMNNYSFYKDIINDVKNELLESIEKALKIGVLEENIIIDPGLGFAKNTKHNILIIKNLEKFGSFGLPLLVGPSRKRFIGEVLNEQDTKKRIWGTNAVICRCVQAKVHLVRVHEINQVSKTIDMANVLWG